MLAEPFSTFASARCLSQPHRLSHYLFLTFYSHIIGAWLMLIWKKINIIYAFGETELSTVATNASVLSRFPHKKTLKSVHHFSISGLPEDWMAVRFHEASEYFIFHSFFNTLFHWCLEVKLHLLCPVGTLTCYVESTAALSMHGAVVRGWHGCRGNVQEGPAETGYRLYRCQL